MFADGAKNRSSVGLCIIIFTSFALCLSARALFATLNNNRERRYTPHPKAYNKIDIMIYNNYE